VQSLLSCIHLPPSNAATTGSETKWVKWRLLDPEPAPVAEQGPIHSDEQRMG
jgi:hypothetical protein